MSVVQKFLLGAASLLLTISLITLGVRMFEKSKTIADTMANEQEGIAIALEEQGITKYDGYQINGSTAINYIKVVNAAGVDVEVTTSNGTFTVSDDTLYASFRDMHSDKYINPLMEYRCTVVRDANNMIVKVVLVYVA